VKRIADSNRAGDQDGGVYPCASLMVTVQKLHDREQWCGTVRCFRIIGYETATRVPFQNLDGCCVPDSNGSTDEGVLCERSSGKITMKVGPKTPRI
jgi:hypothetical protein